MCDSRFVEISAAVTTSPSNWEVSVQLRHRVFYSRSWDGARFILQGGHVSQDGFVLNAATVQKLCPKQITVAGLREDKHFSKVKGPPDSNSDESRQTRRRRHHHHPNHRHAHLSPHSVSNSIDDILTFLRKALRDG